MVLPRFVIATELSERMHEGKTLDYDLTALIQAAWPRIGSAPDPNVAWFKFSINRGCENTSRPCSLMSYQTHVSHTKPSFLIPGGLFLSPNLSFQQ